MDSVIFFRKTLKDCVDGPEAVGWRSKESQEIRFKILSEIGNLEKKSILDVGCGLGDFYGYLTSKGKLINYTGYDILPEMAEAAKKKYPEAEFTNRFPKGKFDYVFESGIFNLKTPNWEKETYDLLRKMWDGTVIGMGINFLSSMIQNQDKVSHYADPIKILEFVYTLTPKFKWDNSYKLNDFTIFLFR